MNYGPCDGGPWDGKKLAHPEAVCDVPIEVWSRRITAGVQRGAPGYEFGEYHWGGKAWIWTPPTGKTATTK
jgi:hypothetical protein